MDSGRFPVAENVEVVTDRGIRMYGSRHAQGYSGLRCHGQGYSGVLYSCCAVTDRGSLRRGNV